MTTRTLTEMERRTIFDGNLRNGTITCAGDVGLGLCAGKMRWRYDDILCARGHVIEMVVSDDDPETEEEDDE